MTKKKKVNAKTRRTVFYMCCCILVILIISLCMKEESDNKTPTQIIRSSSPKVATAATGGRYANINIKDWELDELAALIFLEARNQSAEGQQAVAEVVLNRVLHEGFPNSIHEVIYQGADEGVLQFTTVKLLGEARLVAEHYQAINAALYGEPVLPLDVVFFSRNGENDNVWGKIDDHVFCYAYKWE